MKTKFINLGLISIMLNVDGSMLPETFCGECGNIMIPVPTEIEIDPRFLVYSCLSCGSNIDRCQIDAIRAGSKYKSHC